MEEEGKEVEMDKRKRVGGRDIEKEDAMREGERE